MRQGLCRVVAFGGDHLAGDICYNYVFPSVDVFVEKHHRYSNWEAR
jgi:hypothetical protein